MDWYVAVEGMMFLVECKRCGVYWVEDFDSEVACFSCGGVRRLVVGCVSGSLLAIWDVETL